MLSLRQQPVAEGGPVVYLRDIKKGAAESRDLGPAERVYTRQKVYVAFYLEFCVKNDGTSAAEIHRQDFLYMAQRVAQIPARLFHRFVGPQIFADLILRQSLFLNQHQRQYLRLFKRENMRRPIDEKFRRSEKTSLKFHIISPGYL